VNQILLCTSTESFSSRTMPHVSRGPVARWRKSPQFFWARRYQTFGISSTAYPWPNFYRLPKEWKITTSTSLTASAKLERYLFVILASRRLYFIFLDPGGMIWCILQRREQQILDFSPCCTNRDTTPCPTIFQTHSESIQSSGPQDSYHMVIIMI
jgi:hypothetical protein